MKRKTLIAVGGLAALIGLGAGIASADRRGDDDGWHGRGGHKGGWHGRSITKEDAIERARGRFGEIDANGDGTIDRSEIEQMMARRKGGRGGNRMEHRFDRMLARFDADKDQRITAEEFQAHANKRFARMDLDSDGAITDADLPPMMRGRGVLEGEAGMPGRGRKGRMLERLKAADTDKDGKITNAEVVAAAMQRFSGMDRNGDGVIDKADSEALVRETTDYRVLRFLHRYDATAAGTVSRDAFIAKAEERFASRDRDGDGTLERDEMGHKRGGHQGWGRGEGRGHHGRDGDARKGGEHRGGHHGGWGRRDG